MPLPNNGTAWPPASPLTQDVNEWSAWYSGDPDTLSTFYGAVSVKPQTRASQHRGGVVGRIARWWWGQPTADGEQRAKLHVPLAADICGTSADLLFSESLTLTSKASDTLEGFLTGLQEDGLDTRLHEGAEVQAALGGVYLRSVWDADVAPRPWTEVAHPDGAVPEFRHGRLRAVTLWSELPTVETGVVHRLLERHEPGAIIYGLYAGTPTNLGHQVPLPDHDTAADLAYLVDEDGVQETGITRLAVQYVPNMLPNRLHRTSPQGRSDLQGVTPFFDALDEAYSSWWRDIRLAKSRIYAPAQYLQGQGPGEAALADVDRELLVPLDGVMAGPSDGMLLTPQQFTIRVQEHLDTCKHWTEVAVESAGYSTQSLSSGTGGAVTAAEVHAHERRSYMTRGKKIRYWKQALRAHLAAQAELANVHLKAGLTLEDFEVEFSDGVQDSAVSLAQTAQALRNAEAASTATRVRMVHPDWSQDEVDTEVDLIMREAGGPAADPLGGQDAGF